MNNFLIDLKNKESKIEYYMIRKVAEEGVKELGKDVSPQVLKSYIKDNFARVWGWTLNDQSDDRSYCLYAKAVEVVKAY